MLVSNRKRHRRKELLDETFRLRTLYLYHYRSHGHCWYLPFSSVFTHLTLYTSALRLTDTAAIAFIESPNHTPVLCYLQQFRAFFFLFFFLGGRTSQASSKTQMTGGEAKQLAKINTTNPLLPSVRDIVPKIPFAPFSNFSIYVDFQKRVAP